MPGQIPQSKEFRSALGSFATGVTIVTTAQQPDDPVGVTASSFNSVSLDPPLVLWSLAKSSKSIDAFTQSGHFAIHVLNSNQEELSNRFARSGEDKFASQVWEAGALGSPILNEYMAKFECRTVHQYEGGDHIIFVGEVMDFEHRDHAPLVFHGGQYAETRPRGDEAPDDGVEVGEGRFTEDFFLYLLSRSYFQTSNPTRQVTEKLGLTRREYFTLTIAAVNNAVTADFLRSALNHTGHAPNDAALADMVSKGLLTKDGDAYDVSDLGRDHFLETLSVAKDFEDKLLDHFSASEITEAKRILKKIIRLTGGDIPTFLGE